MLVFHEFPSLQHAEAFARSVTEQEKLPASFHATQGESNAVDPFPFELVPPIVLVGRGKFAIEEAIKVRVEDFGGEFAGT